MVLIFPKSKHLLNAKLSKSISASCKCCLGARRLLWAGPARWNCSKMCSDTNGSLQPQTCTKWSWPPCAGSNAGWEPRPGGQASGAGMRAPSTRPALSMWPFPTGPGNPQQVNSSVMFIQPQSVSLFRWFALFFQRMACRDCGD